MAQSGLRNIIDHYKKEAEKTPPTDQWIRRLFLKDNEYAFFRFLATGDDKEHRFQSYYVHTEAENGRFNDYFCTMDETGICERCLTSKPKAKFGVWVWVEKVFRSRQNPSDRENAKKWKKIKWKTGSGSGEDAYEVFYQQDINDVRLWTSGPGKGRYIINQIMLSLERFGTLMDRQYVMHREGGAKENTNYTISPTEEKMVPSDKELEVYKELPPVVDVLSGRAVYPPRDNRNRPVEDDGEEAEVVDAPRRSVIPAPSAKAVEITDDGEEVEMVERVSMTDDDEITKSIDAALGRIDADEDEDEEEEEVVVRRKKK